MGHIVRTEAVNSAYPYVFYFAAGVYSSNNSVSDQTW